MGVRAMSTERFRPISEEENGKLKTAQQLVCNHEAQDNGSDGAYGGPSYDLRVRFDEPGLYARESAEVAAAMPDYELVDSFPLPEVVVTKVNGGY